MSDYFPILMGTWRHTRNKNNQESDFFALLQDYFPILFDIKYIAVTSCENLKGGLNRIAEILEVSNLI